MVPPPDAVVGRHGPRVSGHCQRRVGFGDSLPVGPPPIADGTATSGCAMEAGENLVRGATGGAQSQPATKQHSVLIQDVMVH